MIYFYFLLFIVINGTCMAMVKPNSTRPYAICGTHINGKPINTDVYDPSWTEIHRAACNKDIATLLKLIDERKATRETIDPIDQFGQTPLWWAAKSGQFEAVQVLLLHGASVDHEDIWKRSPRSLMSASSTLRAFIPKEITP